MLIADPRWAPWVLDTEAPALIRIAEEGICDYPVDLDRCNTAAELLDWIFHLRGRFNTETMAAFLRAADDVLKPQANLCTGGQGRTLSRQAIRRLVRDAADRTR